MSTCIIAGCAVVAFKDIAAADQTLIRDLILRAILSAKDKFNAAENPSEWLQTFYAYLSSNGFKGCPDPSTPLPLVAVFPAAHGPTVLTVYQQLNTLLHPIQSELANQALGVVLDSAKALELLGQQSNNPVEVSAIAEDGTESKRTLQGMNFMVGVCSTTPSGNIILEFCHIGYKYDEPDVLLGLEHIFDMSALSHIIEYPKPNSTTASSNALNTDESALTCNVDMSANTKIAGDEPSLTWADTHIKKSTGLTVIKAPKVFNYSKSSASEPEKCELDIYLSPVPIRIYGYIYKSIPYDALINVDATLPIIGVYRVVTAKGSLDAGISIVTKGPIVGSTVKFSLPRTQDSRKHLILDVTMNTIVGDFKYPHIDIVLPWV
ncbi:hypothetical protein B0H15DRAFT_800533 [Mycena belliarum]|uniref:Uncharacterized protein n=1 Tax=Mycena belliarum TaxID=1033014 RepID=A0AAD6XRJ8_9AGAR|nr:hypothetical protein B0H15DRAFT_800533 [Mycena belliae]